MTYDWKQHRTTPRDRFMGGHTGHGYIEPMREPTWLERLLRRVG